MVFVTSDLHFFHDREFIYKPRGFNSVEEMNNAYVEEWKNKISENDDVYVLGDFCLGNNFDGIISLLKELPGKIHLIAGNHDTDNKIAMYKNFGIDVKYADKIKYMGRTYFLSHYPTMTSNLESDASRCVVNLHGHLHVKERFYNGLPYVINISVDANNNRILSMSEVQNLFLNEIKICESYL